MHYEKLCSKCKTAVHKSSSAIPGMEILYVILRESMLCSIEVCEFLILNHPAGDICNIVEMYRFFFRLHTCSLTKKNMKKNYIYFITKVTLWDFHV